MVPGSCSVSPKLHMLAEIQQKETPASPLIFPCPATTMSDRRTQAMPASANTMYVSPQQQWHSTAPYPAGYGSSPTAGYPSSSYGAHSQSHHPPSSYPSMMAQTSSLPAYQTSDTRTSYAHDRSPPLPVQQGPYPPVDRNGVPIQPPPPVQTQYTYTPPHAHPPPGMPPYAASQSPNPNGVPPGQQHSPHPQYPPTPAAYAQQQIDAAQFPASPQRPFSCDMCALSFNRQHDLKRHRDTHTGEKPFLCNGGCGKTFTRKDALKRHQVCALVISLASCAHRVPLACEAMWHRRGGVTMRLSLVVSAAASYYTLI